MRRLVLLLLLGFTSGYSQDAFTEHDWQDTTDELLAHPDGEADFEALYENVIHSRASKVDLNKAERQHLERLHILSEVQIKNFMSYRERAGPLIDIHELQTIPDFDQQTIQRLLPFVMVRNPHEQIDRSLLRRMFTQGQGYWLVRYQRTLTPVDGAETFLGSPDKITMRYRSYRSGDYSIGFTGEKDAGERMRFDPKNHQYGFDFTSLHLQLRNKRRIDNIVAGDFQAQFGQGLILGGGFGVGKGGESVATVRKSNVGFLPYTSADENAGRRGIAVALSPAKHISISAFAASSLKDGRVNATDGDPLYITSLSSGGYHRTPSEMATRKSIRESTAGLVIDFNRNTLNAGVVLHGIKFDIPVQRRPTLYNQFAFNGRASVQESLYVSYRLQNIALFGEAGHSSGGGTGWIAGALLSLTPNFETTVLHRSYSPDFHTFYSNALSENSIAQNEKGIYWGWKFAWRRRITVNGYVDLFSFPWLGFRRYAPSTGREWMVRARYSPKRRTNVYLQLRSETKDRNRTSGGTLYQVAKGIKRNVLMQGEYGVNTRLRLKTRVQLNTYTFEGMVTRGIAIAQDISFLMPPFRITARHALFDTDTYENRHYLYENDAWLAYSFPAYEGSGVRNYCLLQTKISPKITVWLRYARTFRPNSRLTAFDDDEIPEIKREDVNFQVRIAL